MANVATTVYANVVNFRLTGTEFVMGFGAHFPDRPGPPPSDFKHDVRVVLPAAALQGILQALSQAAQQQVKKQVPGFQGPTGDKKETH